MTARPAWWPLDALNAPGRYTVTVDGEAYGFRRQRGAALFLAYLEARTEKVALYRDNGGKKRAAR